MATPTVAEYLLRQLHHAGVDHVFGVPGDYVLRFYEKLARSLSSATIRRQYSYPDFTVKFSKGLRDGCKLSQWNCFL